MYTLSIQTVRNAVKVFCSCQCWSCANTDSVMRYCMTNIFCALVSMITSVRTTSLQYYFQCHKINLHCQISNYFLLFRFDKCSHFWLIVWQFWQFWQFHWFRLQSPQDVDSAHIKQSKTPANLSYSRQLYAPQHTWEEAIGDTDRNKHFNDPELHSFIKQKKKKTSKTL